MQFWVPMEGRHGALHMKRSLMTCGINRAPGVFTLPFLYREL